VSEPDIDAFFRAAVKQQASDILITAGIPVVLRINGALVNTSTPPLDAKRARDLVYSVLRSDQIAKFEQERELDFSITVQGAHRFRGNAFWQRKSVAAAFRLIQARIPPLDSLGLPPIMEELALAPQGLLLFTGPTGQGKSTTQASMIDRINSVKRQHIITVEDPIEYLHTSQLSVIEQREVGDDTPTFASALKHVLRQDPDVILIGEMRDLETIGAAITAAETGHLVLATLHTNDSVQAIDRLLDVFPPHQQGQVRTQLALALIAVISQRLLPRVSDAKLVCVVEVLIANAAVRNLIREGKTHQVYSIMETHAKEGMRTMDQALKDLYFKGTIAYEEASKRMRNPSDLRR